MTALNDKFEVLRGWLPGGDSNVDQSFPPRISGGLPVTLQPGHIVEFRSDGTVDVSTATVAIKPVYVVVEGNNIDKDTVFVGKVMCLRGKLTIKTDKLGAAQSFPVGGGLTFTAGLLMDLAGGTQLAGFVVANNVSVDGTITAEIDL